MGAMIQRMKGIIGLKEFFMSHERHFRKKVMAFILTIVIVIPLMVACGQDKNTLKASDNILVFPIILLIRGSICFLMTLE